MKNRAKCKLCENIIESKHRHDFITCPCGEISVDGGNDYWRQMAKHEDNFIRLNDDDTIMERQIDKEIATQDIVKELYPTKPTKKELIDTLENMSKKIQELPDHAMHISINHYDWGSLLLLLIALFKADCAEDN
jgi:hypothetical protein